MKTRTYQFEIGQYRGIVLYDQSAVYSIEELGVGLLKEDLEPIATQYGFQSNQIPLGYNNLLLKACGQNILVDAGIRRPIGELVSGLESLEIDPADIDVIIITHADRDHIGGILDQEGEISFPNARYMVLEESWQYWSSAEQRAELRRLNKWDQDRIAFAWETYAKIEDLIRLVKSGAEFMPGLRLFAAPGHRYDHSILKVISSGKGLVHISDALTYPLFMADRDWYSTYDANPAQAVETKRKLLDMCAAEKSLVFGAHFPFPGLGYIQQGHTSWKWQPLKAIDKM